MKMIMQEYGKALFAVTVACVLLAFWWNRTGESGVWKLAAGQTESVAARDLSREANVWYRRIREREKPVIYYRDHTVHAGTRLDWSKLFGAKDADGEQIAVSVCSVNGEHVNRDTCFFPHSGIFQIEVTAEDGYGLISRSLFTIPVQRALLGKEKK